MTMIVFDLAADQDRRQYSRPCRPRAKLPMRQIRILSARTEFLQFRAYF